MGWRGGEGRNLGVVSEGDELGELHGVAEYGDRLEEVVGGAGRLVG